MMINDGAGHYVISVANLDPAVSHLVTPGFPMNGTWYRYNGTEAEDGTSFAVTSNADTPQSAPVVSLSFHQFSCRKCQLVYKAADAGPGTLRYALSCAQPGDTIRFFVQCAQ